MFVGYVRSFGSSSALVVAGRGCEEGDNVRQLTLVIQVQGRLRIHRFHNAEESKVGKTETIASYTRAISVRSPEKLPLEEPMT